jgi:hypothetical protein
MRPLTCIIPVYVPKYEQEWLSTINSVLQRILPTYKSFKTSFKMENDILSKKLQHRRYFTKLRISSHSLHIEKIALRKGLFFTLVKSVFEYLYY